jgi:hypothetical protein
MTDLEETKDDDSSELQNPFAVESPEVLSPEQVAELFVEDFTDIETVKQRKHAFIWGSRGAGKSMMLSYLEPQCQAIKFGGIDNFLSRKNPFLGLYCPCKEGQLNKTELLLLDKYSSLIVSEHMINLAIADRLIDCLLKQFPTDFFDKDQCVLFAKRVVRLFDSASIASSIEKTNAGGLFDLEKEPLPWLQELFATENREVGEYLRENAKVGGGVTYKGATSGYHDFLLPLVQLVKGLFKLRALPIYILLDDAGRLTEGQQTVINSWVANRDQSMLCLKVSSPREDYRTFLTRDGGIIEQPHDYTEIDVEELYTRSKDSYSQKVKLIAAKRLQLANMPTLDIEEFLPPDPTEEELLKRFREETKEEWHSEGEIGRQHDWVTRYATARLFQHLRKTKQDKSYAGFQNMVHLSSGVVRDFLEPCYLMFDEAKSRGQDPKTTGYIPPIIQNIVLRKYSEDFLLPKLEKIQKNIPPEEWQRLDALKTLLNSLGRLFYERLHDPAAREARLFSFTVRGQLPSDIEQVLRLGVRHRYFQLRTYSTKEGGGREDWYILNRRLCPIFKLDPTGFEGRISLTPNALKIACENPERFVRFRLKQAGDEQLNLFSLEEEEEG